MRLTKTDGARQQQVFVRRESVFRIQGAAEAAVPTPERAEPSGSGTILHFQGGPGHTIIVTESLAEVVRLLEEDG